MDKESLKLFLKELTELSNKYNLYISGCGCCSSPRLDSLENYCSNGDLEYDTETNQYIYLGRI